MCSRSVSGSSLLSGYDDDDARETSGRSQRDFDQIDAVLYDEEVAKRSSIKRICEEWSSKPHFRIRGRLYHVNRQQNFIRTEKITPINTLSSLDFTSSSNMKNSSFNSSNELNTFLNDTTSGRSSLDSIEGSELSNNSDLDDDDASNTYLDDRFSGAGADSFDTDEDDDENGDHSSNMSRRDRRKYPKFFIKSLKKNIINSLTSALFKQYLNANQSSFQQYARNVCTKNHVGFRSKFRPSSLPPRPLSQNRYSLPITSLHSSIQQQQMFLPSSPFRTIPEPTMELNDVLRIIPYRLTNPLSITTTVPSSPRKSQIQIPPPPPPPSTSTSIAIDKRNLQPISLIGTSLTNLPLSLTFSAPNPSQLQIRQTPSSWRYRSATTINSTLVNSDLNPRLPPIVNERSATNDQLILNRSNTMTTTIIESIPAAPSSTRAVSGTSTGSNFSSTAKLRTLTTLGKLQRTSRPVTISSTKELLHSSATSPSRSLTATTTTISTTAFKTTPITRPQQQQQHHQKRPLVTTKPSSSPPPSGVIKVSATHIC